MTREEQLDWLCRLRSDISYMNFSIDVKVSLERKRQYKQALSEAIEALEQEPCEDCINRKAVLNTLEFCDKALDVDRTVESYKSLLAECYKMLSSIQPKPKTDVLDKIRTEIIQMPTISFNANDIYKADVLAIIDKYKTESEDKE